MGRTPCCSKVGLHRGAWSSDEDKLLTNYIQTHGEGEWRSLPSKAGLLRCGKSCRLRWMNYLRPGIKRGNFTSNENDIIIRLQALHGNRWSLIATELSGRTDNEIKNYWNAHLCKEVENSGNNHNKTSKRNKKRKRNLKVNDQKTDSEGQQKLKKVKVFDCSYTSTSSSSSLTTYSSNLSKNEIVDHNGMNRGELSSCMIELGDEKFGISWPNSAPFLDKDTTSTMYGHHGDVLLMDGCDLSMLKDDESLRFERLYHEFLNLIDYDDVGDGDN